MFLNWIKMAGDYDKTMLGYQDSYEDKLNERAKEIRKEGAVSIKIPSCPHCKKQMPLVRMANNYLNFRCPDREFHAQQFLRKAKQETR